MKSGDIDSLLFTVYLAAASGRYPAFPCFVAFLVLIRFSGLFAFTHFFFQTPKKRRRFLRGAKVYNSDLSSRTTTHNLPPTTPHPTRSFKYCDGEPNLIYKNRFQILWERFLCYCTLILSSFKKTLEMTHCLC